MLGVTGYLQGVEVLCWRPMVRYVRVDNHSSGTLVGDRVLVARSARDRMVGLLRTSGLGPGEGLWIERSPSIHMFFMRFPIDAVFVSAEGRVTKVVPNLQPWRVVWWARGARDCLELPAGAAAKSNTHIGDQLRLVPSSASGSAGESEGPTYY
jgi:uncharacterized protein